MNNHPAPALVTAGNWRGIGQRMDIGIAIKDLGSVEISGLKRAVLDQEAAAWTERTYRQEKFDVHSDTQSILLVFCEDDWPSLTVCKEPGWDRLSVAALPVIHDIIARHYTPGGTIIRAMAARLRPGGRIRPHRDSLASFHHGHRIHLPLATNADVRFTIEGRPYPMEVGHAYEINNQKAHSVMNNGDTDRIHFIFDYVP